MTATAEHLLTMPRIWDELWAEHGPAIRAAELAALEARAATDAALPCWGLCSGEGCPIPCTAGEDADGAMGAPA